MPKFIVYWSKAYYMNGTIIVDAKDADEAYDIVDDEIGNYEGSMDYYPDDNSIEVTEA